MRTRSKTRTPRGSNRQTKLQGLRRKVAELEKELAEARVRESSHNPAPEPLTATSTDTADLRKNMRHNASDVRVLIEEAAAYELNSSNDRSTQASRESTFELMNQSDVNQVIPRSINKSGAGSPQSTGSEQFKLKEIKQGSFQVIKEHDLNLTSKMPALRKEALKIRDMKVYSAPTIIIALRKAMPHETSRVLTLIVI